MFGEQSPNISDFVAIVDSATCRHHPEIIGPSPNPFPDPFPSALTSKSNDESAKRLETSPLEHEWKLVGRIVRRITKWRRQIAAKLARLKRRREFDKSEVEDDPSPPGPNLTSQSGEPEPRDSFQKDFIKDMLVLKSDNIRDTTLRRCRCDTAAPLNLVSESSLDGLPYEVVDCEGDEIVSITGKIAPKGTVMLRWRFRREDEVHEDKFFVLSRNLGPDFDLLIGRDWMNRNGYVLGKKQ